ncbi:MAG TPA: hypothetical protein VF549_17280 [Solirubrobacteraceae bacterium]|jgi:hypothetical protein
MARRVAAALLSLAALGAGGPTAGAAEIFEGDPAQGTVMDMRVGDDGRVKRVIFDWGGRCRDAKDDRFGDYTGGGRSTLRPARSSPRRFVATSAYRSKLREGEWLHIRIHMRGSRVARKRWKGTYRAHVDVYRDGRKVDVCYQPTTVWKARRIPRWRLAVSGDAGDYVTQGRTLTLGPPAYRAYSYGDGDNAAFSVKPFPDGLDSWYGEFAAPPGERLEVGRTYRDAWRASFPEGHAGLDFGGDGRGCDVLTGEFTIHALEFVREVHDGFSNEIRRLRVSFVQYCGSEAAARGTFDYSL